MRAVRRGWLGLAFAVGLAVSTAGAQPAEPPAPAPPVDGAVPPAAASGSAEVPVRPRDIVRMGVNYTVAAGERVQDLVVIFGTATVDGRVDGDLVVVLGSARLGSGASVGGELVVVGGPAVVASGATVEEGLVVVGGALDAPPDFAPGGEQVVIGSIAAGDRIAAFLPWLTRGLLWGRPIVPDLGWVWAIAGVFALVYLVLTLVFDRPVRACAEVLTTRPLTTGLVGLLVLLLLGPVSFVLAVSVVGLIVVPLVACAVLLAALLGKAGVARWIGSRVVTEVSPERRLQALRSVGVGLAVICVAYVVPVVGMVSWVVLGTLGLGAAATVFVAGLRREHPRPPVPPPPIVPPAPAGFPPPAAGAVGVTGVAGTGEGSASASAPMHAASSAAADPSVLPRASFGRRLAAFVLDAVLVAMVFGLLDLDEGGAFLLLLLAYHVALWAWKGTTVGGIICQLRVVRTDGGPVRFADALVRGLASVFSFAVAGLGCLWILKDAERQAWHDKIAGTLVVEVPRHWRFP
jgi:uncharacterized RDD family membrane protein YckC